MQKLDLIDRNNLPTLKVNVPSFLQKMYEILENDTHSDLISWNTEGTAFIVYNPAELSQTILAIYFKHKNYPSFLRQLNMYNFKKIRNQYGQSEFRHKWFRRGQKNMLQYIRRRNQEQPDLIIETKESSKELENYKKNHQELQSLVRDLQVNQEQLSIDFFAQKEQSAQLYNNNQNLLQNIDQINQQFNSSFSNLLLMLGGLIQNNNNLQFYKKDLFIYMKECMSQENNCIKQAQLGTYYNCNPYQFVPQQDFRNYYFKKQIDPMIYHQTIKSLPAPGLNYQSTDLNSAQSSIPGSPYNNFQYTPFQDQRHFEQFSLYQI